MKSKNLDKTNPDNVVWVCMECGLRYGAREPGVATWHTDPCGVCGTVGPVTEPRDFGYLVKLSKNSKITKEQLIRMSIEAGLFHVKNNKSKS